MKKLILNKEFVVRYLGVAALFACLGGWFAYDGFVAYPKMTAAELYKTIEKSEPQTLEQAEKVANNAIRRQKEFMILAWVAALYLVWKVWSLTGKSIPEGKAEEVDTKDWGKKGIAKVKLGGKWYTLDTWYYSNAKELFSACNSSQDMI